MAQQQTMSQMNGGREGWTGLINSLIGLTSAATVFSIQQMQNAFTMLTDSRSGVNRIQHSIDSISHAMTSEVDPSMRSTAEQVNRTGSRVVNATADAMSGGNASQGGQETEDISGRKR
jgi:hypothetical protein